MKYLWYTWKWIEWLLLQPVRIFYLASYYMSPGKKETIKIPVLVFGKATFDKKNMKIFFEQANHILEQAHIKLDPKLVGNSLSIVDSLDIKNYFTRNKWKQFQTTTSKWKLAFDKVDYQLGIFILDQIKGKSGFHFPRMNHIILEEKANASTLAHEIAHAGDLIHAGKGLLNPSFQRTISLSKLQRALLWSSFR